MGDRYFEIDYGYEVEEYSEDNRNSEVEMYFGNDRYFGEDWLVWLDFEEN